MNFTNLNIINLIIFLIIIVLLGILSYKSYFKQIYFNERFNLLSSRKYFYVKYIFLLLAGIILSFSILGIKYGEKKNISENPGLDTIFVLDVSKSMNVADILGNDYRYTRLDVIKDSISNFIINHNSDRFGLVIFAGDAISTIPLTIDHDIFLTFLQNVDYRNLTKQGSDFEKALNLGINRFNISDERSKVLVFISDGGDKDDNINYNNIKEISRNVEGINYAVVGVGTKDGGRIITGRDAFGRISYQTYNGEYVNSSINKDNLKEINSALNGDYFELRSIDDLNNLDNSFSKLEKKSLENHINGEKTDLGRILTIISFIFFCLFLLLYILEEKIYTLIIKRND